LVVVSHDTSGTNIDNPHSAGAPVGVSPETYIRAETDRQFGEIVTMAGGVNRLYLFRTPTPLDKQNVVRMNRDTLYSMGVVDTSKGAAITVPELPEDRYVSVYLVDNDHYTPFVIYTAGTHELPKDTKYLGLGIRIQVFDPKDPVEVALINTLQDQFVITANSADPLPEFTWDLQSLKTLTAQYEKDSAQYRVGRGCRDRAARSTKRPVISLRRRPGGSSPNGTPPTSTTAGASIHRCATRPPTRCRRTTLSGRSPSTATTGS
jgi:hypothetical protein